MAKTRKIVSINCCECGKVFKQYPSQVRDMNRCFCSKSCWYSYKSKHKITWNKGLKGVMKSNSGSIKKGEHKSPKTEFKKGQMSGSNSPSWKGGITSLRVQISGHYKYRQWRSDVFTRDDFTCQNCNTRGAKLHAHHLIKLSVILKDNNIKTLQQALECEELWNINNGQTLCVDCHKMTEGYLVPDFVLNKKL